jgi:hypothetical protein
MMGGNDTVVWRCKMTNQNGVGFAVWQSFMFAPNLNSTLKQQPLRLLVFLKPQ